MSFYRIKWKSLLVLTLIIITMTHLLPIYSEKCCTFALEINLKRICRKTINERV